MKLKLTPRDLTVIQFVAEQGPTRISTVSKYLDFKNLSTDSRRLRRIFEKLEKFGFLHRKQILAGSTIAWPTGLGLRTAGLPGYIKSHTNPSMELLLHSIQVAEIRLIYEFNGAKWNCERSITNYFPNHLPDGFAIYDDHKIIVEIDRTRKNKDRLISIMKVNALAFASNGYVDYWAPRNLVDFIVANKQLLPDNLQSLIRVFEIPGDIS
jgi:hypothetical protein